MTAAFAPDMDSHPAAFKDSPFDSLRVKLDRKVGWVWDEERFLERGSVGIFFDHN